MDNKLFKDKHGVFREWEPGMVITEPGIYLNMPMLAYHGQPCDGPSISSSGLRTIFGESLRHFWRFSSLNKKRIVKPQTEAMILGRAAHHLLLGEADFAGHFVQQPDTLLGEKWNGNRTVCRNWKAEKELDGLTIITKKDLEKIELMEKALLEEPLVQGGILNGIIEASMFWKDEETGIWLKWRPDALPTDSGDAGDLKVVADITDEGISKNLGGFGYHQQGALGFEAMRVLLDVELTNFVLVYVESSEPFSVRVETVAPEEIQAGIEENKAALRLFKHALETNYWPGPKNKAGDGGYLRRTKWAQEKAARRIELINQELASATGEVHG